MLIRKQNCMPHKLIVQLDLINNLLTHLEIHYLLKYMGNFQSFHKFGGSRKAFILCSTPNFSATVVKISFLAQFYYLTVF